MRRIVLWCRGSQKWGLGHIYRSTRLGKALSCKYNVSIITNNEAECIEIIKNSGIPYQISTESELPDVLLKLRPDILVMDQPVWSEEVFIKKLKAIVKKIVAFDDKGTGAQYVDLLINAIIGLPDERPGLSCEGIEYLIFDEKIEQFSKLSDNQEHEPYILVTFGGSDPNNISEIIIPMIIEDKRNKYVIVLGPGYKNYSAFMKKHDDISNLTILYNTSNMAELIRWADVCVVSGGLTLYECIYLKKRTIVMCQIPQQNITAEQLKEYGNIYNLGLIQNANDISLERFMSVLSIAQSSYAEEKSISNGLGRIVSLIDEM